MDEQREQVLRQLRQAAEQGLHSEAFYQMMRKATRLGPVPGEVLQDTRKRHFAGKIPKAGPALPPEREDRLRERLRYLHEPSERARDLNHPVGTVADAIRRALPGFRSWQMDVSKIDLNGLTRRLYEGARDQALSYLLPPGFDQESSGSYLSAQRSLLIEGEDGSILTMGELLESAATQEAFREQMKRGCRWSDTLDLTWKQPEPLELRAVEELLHSLSGKVFPDVPAHFLPHREPRFCAALRMQLGDSPIPAAIGGVLHRSSTRPEETHIASITIHLEPWAAAYTGQVIELREGSAFPWFERQSRP
jgi:hypothetical protein